MVVLPAVGGGMETEPREVIEKNATARATTPE